MGDNGIIQQHLHPENHISICLLCISTCVSVVAKTVWLYLAHKLILRKGLNKDFLWPCQFSVLEDKSGSPLARLKNGLGFGKKEK